jgi:hypothetical protein
MSTPAEMNVRPTAPRTLARRICGRLPVPPGRTGSPWSHLRPVSSLGRSPWNPSSTSEAR